MVKTYKSKAMAALHENVSDLYRVGMIDKKPWGSSMRPA